MCLDSNKMKSNNSSKNNIKQAQGPFDTLEECIATTMEEEDVDEETARGICEEMAEAEEDGAEEAALHEVSTEIVSPKVIDFPTASAEEVIEDLETDMGSEYMGDRDRVSGDLTGSINAVEEEALNRTELDSLVIKQAQRQPGESTEDCIARIMEEEDVDEETARETCAGGAAAEEASVKQAQRQQGETMGECIERVMEEDDVDRATAREACREFADNDNE